MKNQIEEVLFKNISDENNIFVFATQTAADLWADRTILMTDKKAVAMDRFIAWDTFKGESIKSRQKDKKSIPSLMRKIFASRLIEQNAEKPFLKYIIQPEYAGSASNFADWTASLLPSLSMWKKQSDALGKQKDDEDEDLLLIYTKYKEFLDSHNLFDPAWETPPFISDGHHYFVFFPEILSDYSEYEPILKGSPDDITVINFNLNSDEKPDGHFFKDSRQEIKSAVLYIKNLHEKKNIPYTDIAVNVPDPDSYFPYLERELYLNEIPYIRRNSRPLAQTPAGNFFLQLKNCYENDFGYESLKELLLNTELPWLENDLNLMLLDFGKRNNCICNFTYNDKKFNVWQESFERDAHAERESNYFKRLTGSIRAIVTAQSFADINRNYFLFRKDFFNMASCSEKSDRILSRCISELGNLIDLEKEFPDCMVSVPYNLFTSMLREKEYLEQTSDLGVVLLPYKTSACAPYACHIVLDSSQTSASVIYKKLSFLQEDKRQMLLGKGSTYEDPNVSEYFIRLYQMNSFREHSLFLCAEKTFTGYSQLSSYLNEARDDDFVSENMKDSYRAEKQFYLDSASFPDAITSVQKKGFDFWNRQRSAEKINDETALNELQSEIKRKCSDDEGKIRLAYTGIKKFLKCPREWSLHYSVKPSELENEAELTDEFTTGKLFHKILEFYFGKLQEQKKIISVSDTGLTSEYEEILTHSVDEAMDSMDISYLATELLKSTRQSVYDQIKTTIESISKTFYGFNVYGSEVSLNYSPEGKTYSLNGKIDLVLTNPEDGEIYVIDYKSSAASIPDKFYFGLENYESTEDSDSGEITASVAGDSSEGETSSPEEIAYDSGNPILEEELPDFQMAVYTELFENQEKPFTVNNCCYINIKDCKIVPVYGEKIFEIVKKSKSTVTKQMYEGVMNVLHETLDYISARISSGDYSPDDAIQKFSVCNECIYRSVCRRVFTVAGGK